MRQHLSKQNITRNEQTLFARIWAFIEENSKHVTGTTVVTALFLVAVFTFAAKGDLKSQALATATLPLEEQTQPTLEPEADTIAQHPRKTKLAPKAELEPKTEVETGTESGRIIGSGHASYYGSEFAGRPTANGETFNPSALTAAHKTLPFGSRVKVTNLDNGKFVVVRINDRGPFVAGRLIDVSRGAAQHLGMISSGTAQVRLELLS